MELVLIPPITRLEDTLDQKMHLVLPHLLRDGVYAEYVDEVSCSEDDFVILDNGVAENEQVSDLALLILGTYYEVDELIVPDVLGDRRQTVVRATQFVKAFEEGKEQSQTHFQGNLAFVAQGQSVLDTVYCVMDLMQDDEIRPYVSTIMIPRRLVTAQEPHARLQVTHAIYTWLADQGVSVNIHFLGGSSHAPREVENVAQTLPYVRSMDTSMPYVLTRLGYMVDDPRAVSQPHRNDDKEYWMWDATSDPQLNLLQHNIATMRKWASA